MTDVVRGADVSLDLAERLLRGVREAAERRGVTVCAVVLDRGGQLVAAIRMDGAQLVAMPLATDKAYTAVATGMPTDTWEASTQPGGADWGLNTTLGGRFIVFAGGVPVRVDGALCGGLGVSGAPSEVDKACAEAALRYAGL